MNKASNKNLNELIGIIAEAIKPKFTTKKD